MVEGWGYSSIGFEAYSSSWFLILASSPVRPSHTAVSCVIRQKLLLSYFMVLIPLVHVSGKAARPRNVYVSCKNHKDSTP